MRRTAFIIFSALAFLTLAYMLQELPGLAASVFAKGGLMASGKLVIPGILLVFFVAVAMNFSPWIESAAEAAVERVGEYHELPSNEKADFIAAEAASRLKLSEKDYAFSLSDKLRFKPLDVMNLLDELGEDFGVPLSQDDYPEINSINAIADAVREHTAITC